MRERFSDPDSPAKELWAWLRTAPYQKALKAYAAFSRHEATTDDDIAELGVLDRYYLMTYLLRRHDFLNAWQYDRVREVEQDRDGHLDLWARYHGKAVFVDEPVFTTQGWKNHGDLSCGDLVFGPDGEPTAVVGRTPVVEDADCYRVGFNDGYSVVVSGNHLWTVDIHSKSRINGAEAREGTRSRTMDTRQLAAEVELSRRTKTRKWPRIQVAAPPVLPPADLPIDPYVLGAWLGDGTRGANAITSGHSDADEMESLLRATGHRVDRAKHSNCVALKIDKGESGRRGSCRFNASLRDLGIFREKRIPDVYMRASAEQRWSLLQGLMDTDGYCNGKHGQAELTLCNEGLANDALQLLWLCGVKATIGSRFVKCNGRKIQAWRVWFQPTSERPPFRLRRKIENCYSAGYTRDYRRIESVVPVDPVPVSCITVDRPDGLYCVGRRMVTTHNSSGITFAGIIQEVLEDPEITIGIFSHTRGLALKFLATIKQELQSNDLLKDLYPEVLYREPDRESPRWSLEAGIVVKRKGNPRESTVEAWGLVDNMPTGAHFSLRVYDDVVTEKSVTTPEMIQKTTERWELSLALGEGLRGNRAQYIGTRYKFGDTYETMTRRGSVKVRHYPATDDGTINGKPVFMSQAQWDEIKRDYSLSTIACQFLLDPREGADTTFREEWIRVFEVRPYTLNVYIVCDPARTKKKTSDRTAIMVVGLDSQWNRYLLDGHLHRMNLSERWKAIRRLRDKWKRAPGVQAVYVGYEKYGSDADLDYFEEQMEIDKAYFTIEPLTWTRDGSDSYIDRVQRLEPHFRNGRFFFPYQGRETKLQRQHREGGAENLIAKPIRQINEDGKMYNLSEILIDEEYMFFPAVHVDGLDALSRTEDMDMRPPIVRSPEEFLPQPLSAR